MPSLRYAPNDLRPRLREKGPSALSAQQNSLLNTLRLLPAHLPKSHERRAPKPLHVGRRMSTIQGRRVGEWLGQHRSLLGERAIARARAIARRCVDLARRGGRRARYCSYAFSTMTRVPLESSFNSVPQFGQVTSVAGSFGGATSSPHRRVLVSQTRGCWSSPASPIPMRP